MKMQTRQQQQLYGLHEAASVPEVLAQLLELVEADGIVVAWSLIVCGAAKRTPCEHLQKNAFAHENSHGNRLAGRASRAQPGGFHVRLCRWIQTAASFCMGAAWAPNRVSNSSSLLYHDC